LEYFYVRMLAFDYIFTPPYKPHGNDMEDVAPTKQRQGIQSIEAGTRLLRALAGSNRAMMLKDLAKGSGMPPAKAHRYLVSFIRSGLIAQDPATGRYDLGPFALELGLSSLARLDLVRLADPILERLCDSIDETVALAVWGSHGPTVIRFLEPASTITVTLRAGAVLSITKSATGRAFAAFCRTAAVRKMLDLEIKAIATEKGSSSAKIQEEIEPIINEIRNHGVARATGSMTPGINGFSAPIYDFTGNMVAALTTLGSVGHFDEAWSGTLADKVRSAAAELSQLLGHSKSAASLTGSA
jgi:DNA-binding IclR family transcriptional regulator